MFGLTDQVVIIWIGGTVASSTHFPVFQYFLKITLTHKMNGNGSSLDRWKICQSLSVTRSGLLPTTGKYTNHWVNLDPEKLEFEPNSDQ